MSQKRASKVAKRQRRLREKQAAQRRKRNLVRPPRRVSLPIRLVNPYTSTEEREADILLMQEALEAHYGELAEDFIPPLFVDEGDGLTAAPWTVTYQELLLKKYHSLETVEPRWKFTLMMLDDYIDEIHELSEAEYQVRFEHYKQMTSYERRVALLRTYEQETHYAFDAEEILELCVDEILAQEPADTSMREILRSTTLRWIEIVNYIETTTYQAYAPWMMPAIAVCGYALE